MVDAVKVRRDQHRLEVPLQLRWRTLPCWTAAVMKTARPWLSAAKAGISSTTRRANKWPRRRGSRSGDAEPPWSRRRRDPSDAARECARRTAPRVPAGGRDNAEDRAARIRPSSARHRPSARTGRPNPRRLGAPGGHLSRGSKKATDEEVRDPEPEISHRAPPRGWKIPQASRLQEFA